MITKIESSRGYPVFLRLYTGHILCDIDFPKRTLDIERSHFIVYENKTRNRKYRMRNRIFHLRDTRIVFVYVKT